MKYLARLAILALLLSNTACAKRADDARAAYILAGDHGWLEVTLVPASPPLEDNVPCAVWMAFNGEPMFSSDVSLGPATPGAPPLGYRVPAPAGKLTLEAEVTGCVPTKARATLPLDLAKDQLVKLDFDGRAITVRSTTVFEPATLESMREDVLKLQADSAVAAESTRNLGQMLKWTLALNALILAVALASVWRRGRFRTVKNG